MRISGSRAPGTKPFPAFPLSGIWRTFFSAFGLAVRGVFALAILYSFNVNGPHTDATTQRLYIFSGGYVLMINRSWLWKETDVNDFFLFFQKGNCMIDERMAQNRFCVWQLSPISENHANWSVHG